MSAEKKKPSSLAKWAALVPVGAVVVKMIRDNVLVDVAELVRMNKEYTDRVTKIGRESGYPDFTMDPTPPVQLYARTWDDDWGRIPTAQGNIVRAIGPVVAAIHSGLSDAGSNLATGMQSCLANLTDAAAAFDVVRVDDSGGVTPGVVGVALFGLVLASVAVCKNWNKLKVGYAKSTRDARRDGILAGIAESAERYLLQSKLMRDIEEVHAKPLHGLKYVPDAQRPTRGPLDDASNSEKIQSMFDDIVADIEGLQQGTTSARFGQCDCMSSEYDVNKRLSEVVCRVLAGESRSDTIQAIEKLLAAVKDA